ncbi:PREDICTED: bis(5'-adenosyl)-triphosphatase enpp4-like, partial [Rhagoletis zephyria]|uniref:bis(5'-adenosyl)-triphosphatase enpp4-like n=1 Tax=Rhagoletis zephyria TaxID=28612 RepID=UPI0008116440
KSQQKSSPLSRLLIFSFDGFRADALSASVTPTLYSLAATGVTGHMRPTFPSKTFPNHHSIATGLYQPFHGVVNNIFIDPETSEEEEEKKFSVDNGSAFWWDIRSLNWTAAIDLIFDQWLLSPSSPANLVMAYFHEPDSTSHDHGPFSPE